MALRDLLLLVFFFFSHQAVTRANTMSNICGSDCDGENCCNLLNFTLLPPPVSYVVQGSTFNIRYGTDKIVAHNFRKRAPEMACDVQGSDIDCMSESFCNLDADSGNLTFFNFQNNTSGIYQLDYAVPFGIGKRCYVNFQLIQAIPPQLSETQQTRNISLNQGLMLLPSVSLGLPAGQVSWFKDGQNISTGNSYNISQATSLDRGRYIANISNIADTASVEYTVTVNFPPLVTLTATNQTDLPSVTTIICSAIAFPEIQSIELFQLINNREERLNVSKLPINPQLQSDLSYKETLMLNVSDEPSVYRCRVKNNVNSSEETIGLRQSEPVIRGFLIDPSTSTNTSVNLTWSVEPTNVYVTQYTFQYRPAGSSVWLERLYFMQIQHFVIEDLLSGVTYEFRMKATNQAGNGQYTDVQLFRVFSAPIISPTGLIIRRISQSGKEILILTWNPVMRDVNDPTNISYDVSCSVNDSDSIIFNHKTSDLTCSFNADPYNVYYCRVSAVSMWGIGASSESVKSNRRDDSDPNFNVTIKIVEILDGDSSVVVRWQLTGHEYVQNITIEINHIEITSFEENTHQSYNVFVYKTSKQDTELCFSNLNQSSYYSFCVIAVVSDTREIADCLPVSTGRTNRVDQSDHECISVLAIENPIPAYVIVIPVVLFVLVVLIFFGGCGLYFGIKRNQKNEGGFDSPHPSLDANMNGSHPYPATNKKSSPSRSCMVYRHNHQHQHGIDWRMDQSQGITEV